jgi:hypothetical protein
MFDIEAGDQQDEPSGAEDHSDKHPRFDWELALVDQVDGDCLLWVSARLSNESAQQHIHLGACFRRGPAWLETRVYADPGKVASRVPVSLFRIDAFETGGRHSSTHRQWQPDVRHLLPEPDKSRMSYADDGERLSI